MGLRLVFLGKLEDIAGAAERAVALSPSIDAVIAALEAPLARALTQARVKLAVNGVLVRDWRDAELDDGDEIAFLPPVSGG